MRCIGRLVSNGVVALLAALPTVRAVAQPVDSLRTMSIDELRARLCPPSGLSSRGAILLGFVRDADADTALAGGSASLVYKDLVSGSTVERVRTSRIGADGRFAICGLPSALTGTVQASRSGQVTADLRVDTRDVLFSTVGLTFGTTT